jgi:hypothetical protein
MQVRHWLLLCVIIAVVFLIGGFALHDVIFPPREIIIDTTNWEAVRNWEQITQQSEIIARKLHEFKPRIVYSRVDTFIIYDTTQAQNIPVQLYSECYHVPLLVDRDTFTIPVKVAIRYQLIDTVWVRTDPMPYPIIIKQKQKAIKFWGYGAMTVNSQKRLLSEIRFGVHIGEHLFIYGGSRVDSELDAIAETGIGWRL